MAIIAECFLAPASVALRRMDQLQQFHELLANFTECVDTHINAQHTNPHYHVSSMAFDFTVFSFWMEILMFTRHPLQGNIILTGKLIKTIHTHHLGFLSKSFFVCCPAGIILPQNPLELFQYLTPFFFFFLHSWIPHLTSLFLPLSFFFLFCCSSLQA